MILIAGGTGTLGTQVVRLLTARGQAVRVLTRDPARARAAFGADADGDIEFAAGDVRDPRAVERALAGVRTAISAVHGFAGRGDCNPRTIDRDGNATLIRAARAAGAEHVILLSVHGAAPDHPMELMRMKHAAEQALRAAGPAWTIIRPTAYMETWAALLGAPLLTAGTTRVFGRGHNPINFVSAGDVARFVELAVVDPALRGAIVEVGGPENLSMRQVVEAFQREAGASGTVRGVPLPLMRVMSQLLRPLNPTLARQIQAGVVMDTRDMTFDPTETLRRFPSMPRTSLTEVVRRDFANTDTDAAAPSS